MRRSREFAGALRSRGEPNTVGARIKDYGGMKVSQARRLKEPERDNGRLKKAVAELTLDKLILKEAFELNY